MSAPTVPARLKWLFADAFALGPVLLFLGLAVLCAPEIGIWLNTGMCPAGPMDRVAAPCGTLELLLLTVLGGWVAPLVAVAVMAWCFACIVALLLTLAVRSRRAGSEHPLG